MSFKSWYRFICIFCIICIHIFFFLFFFIYKCQLSGVDLPFSKQHEMLGKYREHVSTTEQVFFYYQVVGGFNYSAPHFPRPNFASDLKPNLYLSHLAIIQYRPCTVLHWLFSGMSYSCMITLRHFDECLFIFHDISRFFTVCSRSGTRTPGWEYT